MSSVKWQLRLFVFKNTDVWNEEEENIGFTGVLQAW